MSRFLAVFSVFLTFWSLNFATGRKTPFHGEYIWQQGYEFSLHDLPSRCMVMESRIVIIFSRFRVVTFRCMPKYLASESFNFVSNSCASLLSFSCSFLHRSILFFIVAPRNCSTNGGGKVVEFYSLFFFSRRLLTTPIPPAFPLLV